MITVTDLELRGGARLLVDHVSFQVARGDKIGLVGRNGAGKTTLLKVLAAEGQPAAGRVQGKETSGHPPPGTTTGGLEAVAPHPILPAPGPHGGLASMRAGPTG